MKNRQLRSAEASKDVMDKLPCISYAVNPGNERQVTMLKRGVMGFWEVGVFPSEQIAKEKVDFLNKRLKVSGEQAEAMLNGSMFGFHVPGADPDNCRKEGH